MHLEALAGREPLHWNQVLVLRNLGYAYGSVDIRGAPAARGMHLILLAPDGSPSKYVKCRPVGGAGEHEAAVLKALAEDPVTSSSVPSSSCRVVEGAHFLAMEIIDGLRLDHYLKGRSGALAEEMIGRILDVTGSFQEVMDETSTVPSGDVDLNDPWPALGSAIPTLLEAGFSTDQLERLEALLQDAGPMPRQSQHGDLAPINIILRGSGIVVLDFDLYGEVSMPLFDAWHLVRLSTRFGSQGDHPLWWEGRTARLVHERGRQLGLDPSQIRGTLAWYLAMMQHILMRRRNIETYWRPLARDLVRLLS